MEDLGYAVVEDWKIHERELRIPFEPECHLDCYRGMYLKRRA